MKVTRALVVALAVLAFGGSACASESTREALPPQGSGAQMKPLVDQFRDGRAQAKSDFERSVLDRAIATGKIAPADYEEAFSRYRQCIEDAGYQETYTKLPNGIYRVTAPSDVADQDAYGNTVRTCAIDRGLASIEALYRTQIDNPDLLADPRLVAVRCLVKAGLVPTDYTADKLTTFLRGDMSSADFDPMKPEAQKCLTAAGIAVQIGPSERKGGG